MNMEQKKKSLFETIRANFAYVVIVVLCLAFLNTCTKSCNSRREVKKANKELVIKDSIINLKNTEIDSLKHQVSILKTEISGLEQTMKIQGEAINQIAVAKKNINVTVKSKK